MPPLPERSVILDRNGNRIATLHGAEDRVTVPFSDIPVSMRQAIVAIEDRRFYEHHGVDYKGIVRAAVTNQESGSVTQGGSTLTQQYVKNVLLESATTPAERKEATRPLAPAQTARGAVRAGAGEEAHQRSDPDQLPQHRQLRRRRIWRRGGRAALLRHPREATERRSGGDCWPAW